MQRETRKFFYRCLQQLHTSVFHAASERRAETSGSFGNRDVAEAMERAVNANQQRINLRYIVCDTALATLFDVNAP